MINKMWVLLFVSISFFNQIIHVTAITDYIFQLNHFFLVQPISKTTSKHVEQITSEGKDVSRKEKADKTQILKGPSADQESTSHAIKDKKTRIGTLLTSHGQVSSLRCILLDRNDQMRALINRCYKSGIYFKSST